MNLRLIVFLKDEQSKITKLQRLQIQGPLSGELVGSLRCYDDYGQNKIIQINGSKENLSFINNCVSNTMSNRKGMKI